MFQQYCARCGNQVGDRSRFCNACGSNLISPGSVTAVPPQSVSPPGSANPNLGYTAAADPAANPFRGYDAAPTPAANPASSYDIAANPFAAPGYGPTPAPAAPYLPGYDRTPQLAASPPQGYSPMPNPGTNTYGYGALNPATYYGVPPAAPRRNWGLMLAVILPIGIIALLLFYFILSGSAMLKFGQVSSAINGNSVVDPGCHFSASGSGLRGELSAAIATMCQTESFHIVMDGKINGQSLSVSGNFKRGAGQFDATAVGVTYHGIIIGNDAYVSYDGQKWLSDNSGQVHNVALFAALFDFVPSDFSDALQDRGYEQMLGGERAHKISASGGGAGTIIGAGSTGSVTFWVIDDHGSKAVRHLQANLSMSGVVGNMDMEYTNFNVPVNVSAPSVAGANAPSLGNPYSGNPYAPSFKQVVPTLGP